MLEAIRINNVKVIRNDNTSFELSDLKRVNYLLGKNGSGKSSVVQVLQSVHALTNITSASIDTNMERFCVYNQNSNKEHYITFLSVPLIELYNLDYYIEMEFNESIYIYAHISKKSEILPSKFQFKSSDFKEILIYAPLIERNNTKFSEINNQIQKHKNQDSFIELVNSINFVLSEFGIRDRIILKGEGEISDYYFETNNEKVSFSHLATGIKHFYELINFVKNQIKGVVKYNKIPKYLNDVYIFFLIDEFETFLHPSIQKKMPNILNKALEQVLFEDYEKDNIIKNKIQFFVCTHSPFVLNSALRDLENGIYHLKDGEVNFNSSTKHNYLNDILTDIGCKPSDLLISNGIIWVEGPSDIILIDKWLKMYQSVKEVEFLRGVHYEYAIYGGAILKYYYLDSYLEDLENKESERIINILTLNPNYFLIFDNDYKKSLKSFQAAKENIIEAIKKLMNEKSKKRIWYENNKEICTIEDYFKLKNEFSNFHIPQKKKNIFPIFKNESKELSTKYLNSKVKGSYSIIFYWEHILKKEPTFSDFEPELLVNISNLYEAICEWNRI